MVNKVCLIIHDGWGVADTTPEQGNAIAGGDTTNMDTIAKEHLKRTLVAHGRAVGVPDGQIGSSETGHLNLGAGRVVHQDILRVNMAIEKNQLRENEAIVDAFEKAKNGNGRLHLLGLVSPGGVHSDIKHLIALIKIAKEYGVPHTYVHFFGDGRDTDPGTASGYCQELLDVMKQEKYGELATIIGRYYAMDRDKRWDRIKIAIDGLVGGVGEKAEDGVAAIKANFAKGVTDEFLKPIIVNGDAGRIKENDTLFFFNFRSDRVREICTIFGLPDPPMEVTVPKNLSLTTMTRYKSDFPFPVAFAPVSYDNTLAEYLSSKHIKQAHLAETEKYAHVTFFFNGGTEKAFEGEERHMISSPKVATYDLQPSMSVLQVAEKVAEVIKRGDNDFVMCNFAPADMVGHTGVYDAAVKAIGFADQAVGIVYKACLEAGYLLMVTADHGNAEQMKDLETGDNFTAHTTNPVPFIIAADPTKVKFAEEKEGEDPGALCDVAPTVLDLMGLEQPKEMTGRSLVTKV